MPSSAPPSVNAKIAIPMPVGFMHSPGETRIGSEVQGAVHEHSVPDVLNTPAPWLIGLVSGLDVQKVVGGAEREMLEETVLQADIHLGQHSPQIGCLQVQPVEASLGLEAWKNVVVELDAKARHRDKHLLPHARGGQRRAGSAPAA